MEKDRKVHTPTDRHETIHDTPQDESSTKVTVDHRWNMVDRLKKSTPRQNSCKEEVTKKYMRSYQLRTDNVHSEPIESRKLSESGKSHKRKERR